MTREEAKKFLPIIQAFAEGKKIEMYYHSDMNWVETNNPSFSICYEYRVKSEPKYSPFNNAIECLAVMNNHKPFGWVSQKNAEDDGGGPICLQICGVQDDSIFFYDSREGEYYEDALKNYVFLDGSPFGIKEG